MDEIQSPCIDICKLDDQTGLCEGCLRTMDEIANWLVFNTAEKQLVLKRIETRKLNFLESRKPK